ncbi:hypothetical protein ACKKBG_A17550 [Auxenochlorella protothecoides x Auxenochlorella symbiontica]
MARTRKTTSSAASLVQDIMLDVELPSEFCTEPPKSKSRRLAPRASVPLVKSEDLGGALDQENIPDHASSVNGIIEPVPTPKAKRGRKAKEPAVKGEHLEPEGSAKKKAPRAGKAAVKPDPEPHVLADTEGSPSKITKKITQRVRQSIKVEVKTEDSLSLDDAGASVEVAATQVVKKKAVRKKKEPDPLPFTDPTPELLEGLKDFVPGPRPIPNLGYACLCCALRELKPPIFTSRDLIKRTLDEKGLPYLGELCLANSRDLARLIQWNQEHGIRFFRMSSVIWPWMGSFDPKELPQYEEIKQALAFAGKLARAYDQRVTFHPSHFVKLGGPVEALTQKSINELEGHAQILDLMGYDTPSVWNKINIHVGGSYGDKQATMERWAAAYNRLTPSCRLRMTVENDDRPNSYSVRDLLELHRLCGVPIVFDFHHWKFCEGDMTQEEALRAAIATWPKGIRPVVHWSESQEGRIPHAHSDYIKGPMNLYGLEAEVDVMIEAKAKERSLLCFRDGLPIPAVDIPSEDPGVGRKAAAAAPFLDD